ncbi:D-alanyl-D-alanine carboxypeptidase family protein [Citricoccus sp. SGAir0253]|uniref:M15 family metallopeptidase n=1 Tax=Citricoccus sp. SGAir0253 TaxID=2567881 RepID=UPI0010CD5246|nr:M15 family metallopeptidase [Citricoccus sp. SGAir0253]QCU77533.1 D-alanyl-D-alanine carboxypeptidase family protein [Citricoccus sp. SGAir0253]
MPLPRRPRRAVVPALGLAALLLAGCTTAPGGPGGPATPGAGSGTASPSAGAVTSPARGGSSPAPTGASTAGGTSAPGSPASSSSTASRSTAPATASSSPAPPRSSAPAPGAAAGHRDPASLSVLVNKQNPLRPLDWAPADLVTPDVPATRSGLTLRAPAARAAEELFAAAAADGVDLSLVSAYRSHAYQQDTYAGWVRQHGRAGADRVSARPGHSEHQTGLALDVGARDGSCTLETCFEDTRAGRWVAAHAVEHGFVIRYPAGSEAVTGYSYEPWHLRYLGTAEAARVAAVGGVLETAWGFPAAPGY